jgi:murein DD-endopeptidase MepM/ murein hydrolase activator NlpD
MVATVIAGGALAAAGQHALAETLPRAAEGANVLRLGVEELVGGSTDDAATALEPARLPVAAEPEIADAATLVKAADMQRKASSTGAVAAAQNAAAEPADAPDAAASPIGSAIQMITGRITSGFGARWGTVHQGLDIAAPIGTPIRVPLDGTVIDSGPASGFGLWVRVRHDDGTITVYGHINRSLVRVGQRVTAGQEIAEVGNRGQATGPHLHIEVITPGGTKINPQPWLMQHNIGI